MPEYALYLESGPRRRKTMIHALDLLGCIAQGPTTEEALEATPEAIRTYLSFLNRQGEAVEPDGPFTTIVTAHVMEGVWLGNGDPTPGFGPDFQPLRPEDLHLYLRRLAGMQADLLHLIQDVPPERLVAEPEGPGRTMYHILEHIAESHCAHLRTTVGKFDSLNAALKAVQHGPESVTAALASLWQISRSRLEATSELEREQAVQHGQVTWTARRGLRRMLEHQWEHFTEISRRWDKSSP